VVLFAAKKLKPSTLFMAGTAAWCFNSLLYTFSRGAYIGAFAGLILVLFARNKKLLLAPLLIFVMWHSVLPQSVVDRIEMTTKEGELDTSSQKRIVLWEEALDMAMKNPVVGVGFDTFAHGTTHYDDKTDTHNVFVKILAEQGIVGLMLMFYLFYLAFRSSWKLLKHSGDNFFKGLGAGTMGCLIASLVANFFGDRWTFLILNGYLWVIVGLVERGVAITAEATEAEEETAAKDAEKRIGQLEGGAYAKS